MNLVLQVGSEGLGESMSVLQAIKRAEWTLPGKAAPDGRIDPRWQAILCVAEHIQEHPEEVWRFARRWGAHASADLRAAIATLLVEHLLEVHFSRIFPLVAEACHESARFADTVSRCWALGQARRPQNMKRLRTLSDELDGLRRRGRPGSAAASARR